MPKYFQIECCERDLHNKEQRTDQSVCLSLFIFHQRPWHCRSFQIVKWTPIFHSLRAPLGHSEEWWLEAVSYHQASEELEARGLINTQNWYKLPPPAFLQFIPLRPLPPLYFTGEVTAGITGGYAASSTLRPMEIPLTKGELSNPNHWGASKSTAKWTWRIEESNP